MSICEICGEEETTITKCITCDTKFCEYCGYVEDKRCVECMEYRDEEEDDNWIRVIS